MEASDHVPRLAKYGDNQFSVGDLENVTAQSYPLIPGPQDEATWPTEEIPIMVMTSDGVQDQFM
jgi:hypothetical protein